MRLATVAVIGLTMSGLAVAQNQPPTPSTAPRPAFDAVSVKINKPTDAGIMRRPTPGRVYFANAPISLVIEEAYGVRPDRLLNVPDWDERFEIVGTYNAELRGQTALMLQTMLEDRFALRVHRETREMPIYELVKARADGQ